MMATDLVPTSDGKIQRTRKHKPPELIKVNGRTCIANGRWNHPRVADHIIDGGRGKWFGVADLGRFAFNDASGISQGRVRKRLAKLWHYMLSRGEVLIWTKRQLIERKKRDGGGQTLGEKQSKIQAIKLYDPNTATQEEEEAVGKRAKRMRDDQDISKEEYELLRRLLVRKGWRDEEFGKAPQQQPENWWDEDHA
jgi:hypothetical protein